MTSLRIDAAVIAASFLVSCGVAWGTDAPVLWFALPLFVAPALYLLWRNRSHRGVHLSGALLTGFLFGFMVDYFGGINGAWTYHDAWFLFPEPIVGHVRPDIMLWAFFWALYTIGLYHRFFDAEAKEGLSRRYVPMLLFTLAGIFNMLYFVQTETLLRWPYAYLLWGVLSFLPVAAAAGLYPSKVRGLLAGGALLALPNVLFEAEALAAGYWSFGGEYVGTYRGLPLEEVLFWTLGSSFIVLANYVLFVRRD